jgi:hypothetical protein
MAYTRLKFNARQAIFTKITSAFQPRPTPALSEFETGKLQDQARDLIRDKRSRT